MSCLRGSSSLKYATTTGTNTWTFLSLAISNVLLTLKIFSYTFSCKLRNQRDEQDCLRRRAGLCGQIPESHLTASDMMDITNVLSK